MAHMVRAEVVTNGFLCGQSRTARPRPRSAAASATGSASLSQPRICSAGRTPYSRHQARQAARWVSALTVSMTWPSSPRYSTAPVTLM